MIFRGYKILLLALMLLTSNLAFACDPLMVSWRESEKAAIRQAPIAFFGTVTKIADEGDAQLLSIRIARGSKRGVKGSRISLRYSLDGGSAACNFDRYLPVALGDRFAYLGATDLSVFSSSSSASKELNSGTQNPIALLYFDYFYIFPRDCTLGPKDCEYLKQSRQAILRKLRAVN